MSTQLETGGNQTWKHMPKKVHKTLILKRLIRPGHWMEHMVNPVTHNTKNKKQQNFL